MSKAVWVISVPVDDKLLVKVGDKVSSGDNLTKQKVSPVSGDVVDIGKGQLRLEFDAEKGKGKGKGLGHSWGELVCVPEIGFLDLDSKEYLEKIIIVTKIGKLFVNKAEVIGVGGIVCCQTGDDLDHDCLPVIQLEKDLFEGLLKKQKKICLIDSQTGCLLIPVAK